MNFLHLVQKGLDWTGLDEINYWIGALEVFTSSELGDRIKKSVETTLGRIQKCQVSHMKEWFN